MICSRYDLKEPASLPVKMETDLTQYMDACSSKCCQLWGQIGRIICGFSLGFIRSWLIALLICSVVPLAAIGGFGFTYYTKKEVRSNELWYTKASAVVEEVLYNLRTVSGLFSFQT